MGDKPDGRPIRPRPVQEPSVVTPSVAIGSDRLHRPPPVTIVRRRSERSAARLAHQSGGLGVPSSNLGAPTIKPFENQRFSERARRVIADARGTKRHQSAHNGTEIPEKVPKFVPRAFTREAAAGEALMSQYLTEDFVRGLMPHWDADVLGYPGT